MSRIRRLRGGILLGSVCPARAVFFYERFIMKTKIYKFCTLCGPLEDAEDAPEDAHWESVVCRQCSYQEAHGMDHIKD